MATNLTQCDFFLPEFPRFLGTFLSTPKARRNHFRIFQNFSQNWITINSTIGFPLSQKRGCSPPHEDKPSGDTKMTCQGPLLNS